MGDKKRLEDCGITGLLGARLLMAQWPIISPSLIILRRPSRFTQFMASPVPIAGAKRRRTSVATKFEEDSDIWEKDGNVVIGVTVVEDCNKEDRDSEWDEVLHLFKCHSIILSQHSPVFRDMLAIPPSSAPEDAYMGLPLVRLPDPFADIKELLRMLYDPIRQAVVHTINVIY